MRAPVRAFAALVVGLAAGGCGDEEVGPGPAAAAAGIEVVDAAGIGAALDARRGQPLLVNFWARWCTPCVAELPDLVAVRPTMTAAGGEVLGITMDLWAPGYELEGSLRALPAFLRERGVDFPILFYGSTDPAPITVDLDLPGDLPFTLAIDRTGRVVRLHEGAATAGEFAELARLAIGS